MRNRLAPVLGLVLLAAGAVPATAQDRSWQNKWYWGAQGGAFLFKAGGNQTGFSAGGHWFVTAGRSALYLAFDQLFFETVGNYTLNSGQQVNFGSGQRFQATVYAVPSDARTQFFLGGGFAIHRITDAALVDPLSSGRDQAAVDDAATKAFLILSGGLQYRAQERWAIFGQYQFMPASEDFVIRSQQHAINIGIRYALTHSEEIVSTER